MNGQLNQSKFLSEQINNEEEPTQQEIIEKAEELGISDLGLAKEALTKQLDQQWKPYLNRRGDVYYINLQEKKAYLDHPVDMEIRITDALRHKKKVPVFKQFAIQEISQSPRLIQQEINRYQRQKGLNIVYEESDEESLRRDTLQSVDEPLSHSQLYELDKNQLEAYRSEMERQTKAELTAYRVTKQEQYAKKCKRSKQMIEQAKRQRLDHVKTIIQQQISAKNDTAFYRSVQTTRQDLISKKIKLEDLHNKQLQLIYKLQSSRQTKQEQVMTFYRTKRYYQKSKLLQKAHLQTNHTFNVMTRKQIELSMQQFQKQRMQTINTKLNFRERVFQSIQKLINQSNRSKQVKKRYPIFNPDLFPAQKTDTASNNLQFLTQKLKINDSTYSNPIRPSDTYLPRNGPSLFLRFSMRIL